MKAVNSRILGHFDSARNPCSNEPCSKSAEHELSLDPGRDHSRGSRGSSEERATPHDCHALTATGSKGVGHELAFDPERDHSTGSRGSSEERATPPDFCALTAALPGGVPARSTLNGNLRPLRSLPGSEMPHRPRTGGNRCRSTPGYSCFDPSRDRNPLPLTRFAISLS